MRLAALFTQPATPGYQLWDSIQGLSSYVRGMLSSQAMLAGVGVGSAAATPLGAVFQVAEQSHNQTSLQCCWFGVCLLACVPPRCSIRPPVSQCICSFSSRT